MGIIGRHEERTESNRTFSEDVLKIELSGPEHDNLSIIDIPGIFRVETPGVTTKEDIDLVKRMVRLYIKNESTIILAVLAANQDINNQEILAVCVTTTHVHCHMADHALDIQRSRSERSQNTWSVSLTNSVLFGTQSSILCVNSSPGKT